MDHFSRDDAVRIATEAIPPEYRHRCQLLGVSHWTSELVLREMPAILDGCGLSSTDIASILSDASDAAAARPSWKIGFLIFSNDFRSAITVAGVSVDGATGATTLDLDTTHWKLHTGTNEVA